MAEFDQYRTTYDDQITRALALSGQEHDFFLKVKAEVLAELLKRQFGNGGGLRALDVGCGNGALHPFLLAAAQVKLTGIEVAPEFVDVARRANPQVAYEVYDGQCLPYVDGSFDVAFAICVMHHVPPRRWPAFVAELRRVVRPGGMVAIFEHNPLNPITAYIVSTCPMDRDAVLLRAGRLDRLLRGAGLSDTCHEFILFTPFQNLIFRRFDRLMNWLP